MTNAKCKSLAYNMTKRGRPSCAPIRTTTRRNPLVFPVERPVGTPSGGTEQPMELHPPSLISDPQPIVHNRYTISEEERCSSSQRVG